MAEIPRLSTDRLLLRPFQDQDLDAYASICSDPEVMRYLGDGQPLSRADAWRQMALILGHWQLRGYGMWAVEERQRNVLIGRLGEHLEGEAELYGQRSLIYGIHRAG